MPPYTYRTMQFLRKASWEEWRKMGERLQRRYLQGYIIYVDEAGLMAMSGASLYSATNNPESRIHHCLVKARRLNDLRRWQDQFYQGIFESPIKNDRCIVCGADAEKGRYGELSVCSACYLKVHPEMEQREDPKESIPVTSEKPNARL